MGLVASRTDWDGDESVVVFRCGSPLGTFAGQQPEGSYVSGDMGHIHPDANHFVIYANGEYILRNNGYVKRMTKYHNTLLVNDLGQWGEVRTWFTPWPLTPVRDPKIAEAVSADGIDRITGDASAAYLDGAGVKKFVRKLVWIKEQGVVIVCDDVELAASGRIELRFFPEQKPVHGAELYPYREPDPGPLCADARHAVRRGAQLHIGREPSAGDRHGHRFVAAAGDGCQLGRAARSGARRDL